MLQYSRQFQSNKDNTILVTEFKFHYSYVSSVSLYRVHSTDANISQVQHLPCDEINLTVILL